MLILDVTIPALPKLTGQTAILPDTVKDVALAGNYAYVADYESGLRIFDASNPTAPVEVGFYDTSGFAEAVTVVGSYAYVADGFNGLRIINITNSAAPTEVGSINTFAYARDVAVVGSYAYVANPGRFLLTILHYRDSGNCGELCLCKWNV
jgi:hypothetical protein